MKKILLTFKVLVATAVALSFVGCMQPPVPPEPTALVIPEPILDNSGEYLFPYTQDEVLAQWTDKAIAAEGASAVGGAVGAAIGAKALEQIPFFGAFLGKKAGEAVAREMVISSAGGMEVIKETSDISFNNINDYCVYAYVKYSSNEHYASAMKAAGSLYSDLKAPTCSNALFTAAKISQ